MNSPGVLIYDLIIYFQLLVRMSVVMLVSLRTGEIFDSSTAWFAIMPTTILSQDDAPPQVARQFENLFR